MLAFTTSAFTAPRVLAEQDFRRGLLPALCQLPQFGGLRVETGLRLGGKRLPEDFTMFALGRAAVLGPTPFQPGDQE
jgi:hypothetical protein